MYLHISDGSSPEWYRRSARGDRKIHGKVLHVSFCRRPTCVFVRASVDQRDMT